MNTRLFSLGVMISSILLFVVSLSAGDVSGKWTGTLEFKTPDGETKSGPAFMILKQDGNKLTGSGGPNESEQHPIRNGKVEGNKLTFEALDGEKTMYFDLKMIADQISGDIKRERDGTRETAKISLKRVTEK